MKNILITGALGQIGTELTMKLRKIYGDVNVVATDMKFIDCDASQTGPFELLNVQEGQKLDELVKKYKIDTIMHLAALLSATAENNPTLAWNVNMGGLINALDVAKENGCSLFTPSSIAAFGPLTPPDFTPQDTVQRPTTIYGVTKVAGENLCDYYHKKFGVDTRGVRYPGLVSYATLPGGGTTDYAVHIYYEALKNKKFACPLKPGTYMDMMYMPDALDAIVQLMEADASKLIHRNAFNITAMSFDPEGIAASIQKHIPEFTLEYDLVERLQKIADSWPNSLDDSVAREEWGWKPQYDLDAMTADMLAQLRIKLNLK